MPKQCKKLSPSELDYDIWRMFAVEGKSREQIAAKVNRSVQCIDYHIVEGKRLIGIDVTEVKRQAQGYMIPIAFQGLQLIHKTFATGNPKYVDSAIKFLRNAGYTIEQSEVTHTLKDSRDASEDFSQVMDRIKNRAVEAESTSLQPDTATISQAGDIDDHAITAPQSDDPPKDDTEPTSSH